MDLYSIVYSVFFNKFGRLRSGWRLALYIFAFVALGILLTTLLRTAFAVGRTFIPSVPNARYYADVSSLRTDCCSRRGILRARLLEGLPWRSLGLTLHKRWVRGSDCRNGDGVGRTGARGRNRDSRGWTAFLFRRQCDVVSRRKIAACFRRAFVRRRTRGRSSVPGYPLQTLTRAGLMWFGVLLTSLPFAFVHLNNPNVVPGVTFANTALAGVAGRRLSQNPQSVVSAGCALGLELGAGLAIWPAGQRRPHRVRSVVKRRRYRAAWLTGGNYGIEGGVACTVAIIVFTLFVWRTRLVSPTPELLQLTSQENPATPSRVSVLS